MFSKTSIAKARYAGRGLALVKHAVFERQGDGVYLYPDKGYLVDVSDGSLPICDCAEYRVNLHLVQAVAEGKKVTRNPGPVCKHILKARVLKGDLDLQGACEHLPEALKAEARKAFLGEAKRLAPAIRYH
jgi:hypothetical protein